MQRRGQLRHIKRGIPQENLTSEWKLEETSGSTFYDSVGTNHGTDADITTLTSTGKIGNCFYYNGQAFSEVPSSSDFVMNDGTNNLPFSFSFWIYNIGGGSLQKFIHSDTGLYIGLVANLLRMEVKNSSGTKLGSSASTASVDSNVWTHLTFVFNPNNISTNPFQIYKNGIPVTMDSGSKNFSITTAQPTLRIGDAGLNSKLDEIKYYKRVLTPSDVSAIYNTEK
jgi:hypothetical protein